MPIAFGLTQIVTIISRTSHGTARVWEMFAALAFVLSCAASGCGFLAVFLRFARTRVRIFDSLRDNAYGMYLVHYGFVTWLQYALLQKQFPAVVKASVVFLGTLVLSWGAVAALRRIPAVARVI
jgi:surface polysaccharide O-acyltransferase-like enzyme